MKVIGKKKTSKGVSLIEVLVAVVVLAFGLLGIAGLQSVSLRNNNSALLRTQATYLAQDIVDRMRINRTEAIDNMNYEQPLASSKPSVDGSSSLAAVDLNIWLTQLENAMPNGDGEIDCEDATDLCVITVQWDDSRGAANLQQFVTSAQL